MDQAGIGVGDADIACFVVDGDPKAFQGGIRIGGVLAQALQQAQGDQGVGAGGAHDFAEQIPGPRAEFLARIHHGNHFGEVPGAGGVGALEIGQPVAHHRGGQPQGRKAAVDGCFAAQAFDQEVGGAVVAHPNHFGGGFKEGEAGPHGPACHPPSAAANHLFGEGQALVPAQGASIQFLQASKQHRRFDGAGCWLGAIRLQLGVATVIEHQEEAAGLEAPLGLGQLRPAGAQGLEFGAGFKTAATQSLAANRHAGVSRLHLWCLDGALGQVGGQQLQGGARDDPQANAHHGQP